MAGCSKKSDGADGSKTSTRQSQQEAACFTTELSWKQMVPEHRTFEQLVVEDKPNTFDKAMAGIVTLGPDDDYGPYGPAIRYLGERWTAMEPEFASEVAMPKRTTAIVESAKRLDHDLRAGMCDTD